jgi:hypothetical protein
MPSWRTGRSADVAGLTGPWSIRLCAVVHHLPADSATLALGAGADAEPDARVDLVSTTLLRALGGTTQAR